ncbi:MAG: MarR family transcriptional regulator [Chloroflexi bacterium]|nr:MarR family transcriptional regulator [Chloroflexota bacterium]
MKRPVDSSFKLWELFNHSFRATAKVRQKELDRYGVTLTQSAVLRVALRLGKKATPTEISRQLFLETNSVSEQLRRMETYGLIRKVKDLDRKNLVRIEVTQQGYELYRKSRQRKYIDSVMSVLTEEEKTELWAMLVKLRAQAVKKLGMSGLNLYPPSDYTDLFPADEQDS